FIDDGKLGIVNVLEVAVVITPAMTSIKVAPSERCQVNVAGLAAETVKTAVFPKHLLCASGSEFKLTVVDGAVCDSNAPRSGDIPNCRGSPARSIAITPTVTPTSIAGEWESR